MERFKQVLAKKASLDEIRDSIKLADSKLDILTPALCREILHMIGGGMWKIGFQQKAVSVALMKLKPVGIFMDAGHLRGCGCPFSEARFKAAVEEYLLWDAARFP